MERCGSPRPDGDQKRHRSANCQILEPEAIVAGSLIVTLVLVRPAAVGFLARGRSIVATSTASRGRGAIVVSTTATTAVVTATIAIIARGSCHVSVADNSSVSKNGLSA
jgi:hypothetical protein